VTIPVECPHCEARFQLQPDLVGKSMRCPECREVFVVQSAATPVEVPPAVPEFIPIDDDRPFERVEANDLAFPEPVREAAPPDLDLNPPTLSPLPNDPLNPPTLHPLPEDDPLNPPTLLPLPDDVRTARPIPPARPLPTAPLLPGPKEVVWSDNAPPPGTTPAAVSSDAGADEQPFIRRRRRRAWPKALLAGVSAALVLTLLATGIGLYRHYVLAESRLAWEAEEAYKDGNYPVAQKKYEQLLDEFAGSSDAEKYRFFAALSATHAAVGSVTTRENPGPALKAFHGFAEEYGQSPFAQPETGYGSDVVHAGRRLAESLADHAGDKLKQYRNGLRQFQTNEGELTAGEGAVREGRRLLPVIDRFRDRQDDNLGSVRGRYDELEKSFAHERHRLAVLAPFRDLSDDPNLTAERIEAFQVALKDNRLTEDPEAASMLAAAERKLRELVGYDVRRRPAVPVPADPLRPVLFAAPVAGSPVPKATPGAVPDVAFGVALGILYALDGETGRPLWGARVAPPTADPRTVVPTRVPMGGGGGDDWVLIAGELAGQPGLTARLARTGDPVWYQPLEAPPADRPVVIGGRVYVPLRDSFGKVVEFETHTGARSGEFSLRQPIGAGIAVLPGEQRGLNYLFIPGDARRVFVFEVGREDADGRQLDPRCVRVFLTEHPRDSLRGEPLVVTPADVQGPRLMILAQTDGPQSMRLRAFPLPDPDALAGPESAPAQEAALRAAEVTVPGWAWFPPQSDGERVVLATDAGTFVAIGVNQAGNADAPLFAIPTPRPAGVQDAVSRSQVVAVEEDAYWAVLAGQLVRLRTAIDPVGGLRIIPQGSGRPVGEPVNRPQVLSGLGLGVVVARPAGSANVEAVGFDLRTGQVRWKRRLGVTPAGPPVAAAGGPCVVADEDGGLYSVNTTPAEGTATGVAADVLAPPFGDLAGRAVVAGSADGRTVWVVAPDAGDGGRRLRVRCVVNGTVTTDTIVPLPDEPAGRPLAFGESVLLPLANGYVYRFTPGDRQLTVGPLWRGDASGEKPECFLTPLGSDEFLTTDGGRRFLRWRWPDGEKHEKTGGPWEARAAIAVPIAVIGSAESPRFASLDITGSVFLFDADKPGATPVRRWRGSDESGIPAGRPTGTPAAVSASGRTLLIYAIDRRHLAALDPDATGPAWVSRDLAPAEVGGLTGWTALGDRLLATDQTGRVVALDLATGRQTAGPPAPPAGTVAAAPAIPAWPGKALLMLIDGSAAILPLPSRPDELPAKPDRPVSR
jgi:outer membrane protein assembly factor BamB